MKAAVIVFPGSNCDRDLAVALGAAGAEVAMVWHKETALPARARPRRRPRRLLLRRLPALRRHRRALAGDAGGRRLRRGRRPRHRRLQRLPGADRGRAAARRADAQRRPEVRLRPGGARPSPRTPAPSPHAYARGERITFPIAHHDGNYVADDGDARPARGRGPRRLPLRRQPERLAARHRRHPLGEPARPRADAAPRARRRPGARRHRRRPAVRRASPPRSAPAPCRALERPAAPAVFVARR